jgi:hypothetical protein
MTEIVLKIDIHELERIYFGKDQGKYFYGPTTKRQTVLLIISLIVYPIFFYYTIDLENNLIFVLGTVLISLGLYDFLRVAKPIIAWKKSVNEFLKKAADTKVLKVIYTEKYFLHISDSKESKVDWTSFTSALINDDLIWLYTATSNFLVPKKSMTKSEFEMISDTVMKKVTNVEKN